MIITVVYAAYSNNYDNLVIMKVVVIIIIMPFRLLFFLIRYTMTQPLVEITKLSTEILIHRLRCFKYILNMYYNMYIYIYICAYKYIHIYIYIHIHIHIYIYIHIIYIYTHTVCIVPIFGYWMFLDFSNGLIRKWGPLKNRTPQKHTGFEDHVNFAWD